MICLESTEMADDDQTAALKLLDQADEDEAQDNSMETCGPSPGPSSHTATANTGLPRMLKNMAKIGPPH